MVILISRKKLMDFSQPSTFSLGVFLIFEDLLLFCLLAFAVLLTKRRPSRQCEWWRLRTYWLGSIQPLFCSHAHCPCDLITLTHPKQPFWRYPCPRAREGIGYARGAQRPRGHHVQMSRSTTPFTSLMATKCGTAHPDSWPDVDWFLTRFPQTCEFQIKHICSELFL